MCFKELLKDMFEVFEKDEIEEIAIVARRIWQRQNGLVFNAYLTHPNSVVKHTKQVLQEFKEKQTHKKISIKVDQNSTQCSKPPTKNVIKINWDAIIDKASCKIEAG